MIATDFQRATADRILEVFKGGQNHILLADEVGLGKTIVASEVVHRVSDWHKNDLHDDFFKVVYICSNAQIASQNAGKLGIKDQLRVSESRLSMQHLKIYESTCSNHAYEQLIPLTPATSFSMTSGCGTRDERALMYVHLVRLPELSHHKRSLSSLLAYGVEKSGWEWRIWEYGNQINRFPDHGKLYYHEMEQALHKHFQDDPQLMGSLLDCCCTHRASRKKESRGIINDLRKLFAEISLDKLEPDLVIMDEFQRFRDLINTETDTEESMLSHKFLDNSNTKVLLLSATPYKPYSTLEEIAADESADHYSQFMEVMDFIFYDEEKRSNFHTVWQNYSDSLCEISLDKLTVLFTHKQDAEDALYQGICRTERFNTGIIDDSGVQEVPISTGDILSFDAMQTLMDHVVHQKENALHYRNVPMDYVKSAPYLLSFMDQYQLKQQLLRFYQERGNFMADCQGQQDLLLLKKQDIQHYQQISFNNARLEALSNIAFTQKDHGAELLLWIPASHPYYHDPDSIFEENRGYSKMLVFSSWEMVPRMVSVMLSYEAERRTIGALYRNVDTLRGRGYFATKKEKRFGAGRLVEEMEDLLCFTSQTLADIYRPEKHLGEELSTLRNMIGTQIQDKLDHIQEKFHLETTPSSAKVLIQCLEYLDGINLDPPKGIPANAAEVLTDMALGSPGVCAFRLSKKCYSFKSNSEQKKLSAEFAKQLFISLFNKPESSAVLDLLYGYQDDEAYYRSVLRYCVEGDLQAVLDEYAHVLADQNDDLLQAMTDSFTDTVSLQIDTQDSFPDHPDSKPRMRTHFAMGYFNARVSDQKVESLDHLRKAFNSPFRPFVLTTTSIGQEGLDFHLYCRKVMHWNLPSNPIDLEQREGRVNRYECLAVRQNIARKYGSIFTWRDMFNQAAKAEKGDHSDLVPHWCLPNSDEDSVHIERIVPMYPFSQDQMRYERIIKTLSLYRLTLGQPRQEELIALLDQDIIKQTGEKLFMNLSPYAHSHMED